MCLKQRHIQPPKTPSYFEVLNAAKKQQGSMIVMSLFIIVVVSLLAAALINIVSASSSNSIHQIYGLRAQQAAKAGIDEMLFRSFPDSDTALACNSGAVRITSPNTFSNITGLNNCSYSAQCVTQTITFANVERLYFKFSSTGSCQIDSNVVSRTLSVDAVQEITP